MQTSLIIGFLFSSCRMCICKTWKQYRKASGSTTTVTGEVETSFLLKAETIFLLGMKVCNLRDKPVSEHLHGCVSVKGITVLKRSQKPVAAAQLHNTSSLRPEAATLCPTGGTFCPLSRDFPRANSAVQRPTRMHPLVFELETLPAVYMR